ncbi:MULTISPECIES: sulfur carrier protein ThiS [Paenibacillus]|uniref:Thiamine biosynthesis protein ThiS n=1 Tax=Paenibacillus kribbensis TaxID=172713 RepID=A0A222WMC6_9BACL|nr:MULTISPECIES: sulfur carrier protein ThiS [Paenibacillus]ASR47256.1 thiamine biosynthesis protein ThiS [Paenibacillus kribbensis]EHS57279.1 thiamine biosynthesis protein ThiS [Paenibacillus sp. Aloe-11]
MKLTINGQSMNFSNRITHVEQLLHELDLKVKTVVVELNRHILTREEHEEAVLKDGDNLEIVHFVGGG